MTASDPQDMAIQNNYDEDSVDPELTANTSETGKEAFNIQSPVFNDGEELPVRYCNKGVDGGENVSPPLEWYNIPEGTKSLFLVIVDTHPVAQEFLHWVVKDIPPTITQFKEGASGNLKGGIELNNGEGIKGYYGPEPPFGTGNHPYEMYIFALNSDNIDISENTSWDEINDKLARVTIASAKITGMYGR